MRFSLKLFLATVCILCLTFALGGTMLISASFQDSLSREMDQASEENRMVCLSLNAASTSLSERYSALPQQLLQGILQAAGRSGETAFRLFTGEGTVLIETAQVNLPADLLEQVSQGQVGLRVAESGEERLLQTVRRLELRGGAYYLESCREITPLFEARGFHLLRYRQLLLLLLGVGGVSTLLLALWLTRPIATLSRAARAMRAGDLSARAPVHSEDEIGRLARDFNSMASRLEGKVEALENHVQERDDFIASFAHELKTPLTSIIGYADLIRTRELSPEQRSMAANYIFTEGRRLERLSFKLMELAVTKKRELVRELADARKLLARVGRSFAPVASQAGIRFSCTAHTGTLLVDPDLMHSLILNLLDNARKATPPDGFIRLEGVRREDAYEIRVTDNGRGMDGETLRRATEPFFMADKSRARSQGGAGLGLALCREIAQLHGGELRFESALGEGTCAAVRLPGGEDADGKGR